jgi:hypothetical protein
MTALELRCALCGKLYSKSGHRCMSCGHDVHIHDGSGWTIVCPCGCEKSSGGYSYEIPDAFVPRPTEREERE